MTGLVRDMTVRYTVTLGGADAGHLAALKALWQLAYREAATMAYADAFQAIMVAFIVATLFVPLLRKVVPPKAPPADAH
jgi:DHA2 family multidrug resistance protein